MSPSAFGKGTSVLFDPTLVWFHSGEYMTIVTAQSSAAIIERLPTPVRLLNPLTGTVSVLVENTTPSSTR